MNLDHMLVRQVLTPVTPRVRKRVSYKKLQESYRTVIYRFRFFDGKTASTRSEVFGKSAQVFDPSGRELNPPSPPDLHSKELEK